MLVLPIATGISGFFPSLAVMAICWFAMTTTALLLLEASLWMKEGAHIVSMTSNLLGPIGKAASWCLYLFICYASIIAYTAGGGLQIAALLESYFHTPVSKEFGILLFMLLFGSVIYVGSWFVGRLNTILFTAMIGAYFALVGMGIDEVRLGYLLHRDWNTSLIAVPLLLTAFSFQTMVPSLTPYLQRNVKSLRIAIIAGTSVAFLIYAVWQWLILGIVPVDGPNGLAHALCEANLPATSFLREHVQGKWIAAIAEYFAFFAIVTSFLGISLGLFDFLADGFKINQTKTKGRIALGFLIAAPTLFFASYFERVFITAMDATGGIGDSLMNGIIPVLMVWVGRYRLHYPATQRTPGGKPLLVAVFALFVVSLGIEILALLGIIPSVYEMYDLLEIHHAEKLIQP